ncbi:hypothetical protein [Pseudomonas putida]|uniref:hypothetical protein n=1 Tax=Pseudomonas putida TaxID=303 RepID=UPI0023632B48|nr:hypothetical protein [Pseudomonas putida]HDS1721646.1 hypothetical protein [Pseudomonas putida]
MYKSRISSIGNNKDRTRKYVLLGSAAYFFIGQLILIGHFPYWTFAGAWLALILAFGCLLKLNGKRLDRGLWLIALGVIAPELMRKLYASLDMGHFRFTFESVLQTINLAAAGAGGSLIGLFSDKHSSDQEEQHSTLNNSCDSTALNRIEDHAKQQIKWIKYLCYSVSALTLVVICNLLQG